MFIQSVFFCVFFIVVLSFYLSSVNKYVKQQKAKKRQMYDACIRLPDKDLEIDPTKIKFSDIHKQALEVLSRDRNN
jgi:hypothetical protein